MTRKKKDDMNSLVKRIPDRSARKAVQIRKPYEGKRNVITDEKNFINESRLKPIEAVQLNELKPLLNSEVPVITRKAQPMATPATMKSSETSKIVPINQNIGADELVYMEEARGFIESGGNMETKRKEIVYKPQGPRRDGQENDLFRTRNPTNFVSFSRNPVGLSQNEDFLKVPASLKSSQISRAPSALSPFFFESREKPSPNHLDGLLQDQEASLDAFSQESARQKLYRLGNNLRATDFSQTTAVPITNELSGTSFDTAWLPVANPLARESRRKPSWRSLLFLRENLKSFMMPTIDDAVLSAVRPVEAAVSLRKKVQLASLVQGLTKSNPIASAAIASAAATVDPRILSVNAPHKLSNKGSVALNQRPLRSTTDNAVDLAGETSQYTDDAIIKSAFVPRPSYKSTPTVTAINFNPTTTANTMADAVEPDQAILGYTKTIARESNKTNEMNVETMGLPDAATTIEDVMPAKVGINNLMSESRESAKAVEFAPTTDTTTAVDVLELDGDSTSFHFQPQLQNRPSTKQTSLERLEDATVRTADREITEVSKHIKLTTSSALLRDTGKRATMASPLGIERDNNMNLDDTLTDTTRSQILSKSFDAKSKQINVEVHKRSDLEFKGSTLDLDDFNDVTMLQSPLVMDEKVRGAQAKRVSFDQQLQGVNISDVVPALSSNISAMEVKRPFTTYDVVFT